MPELLKQDTQRLWDLVRYCRAVLHNANLISDDEYAALAEDHAAVERLEAYDTAKAALHARIRRWYPCRYPQIHKDGKPNGCPDCT